MRFKTFGRPGRAPRGRSRIRYLLVAGLAVLALLGLPALRSPSLGQALTDANGICWAQETTPGGGSATPAAPVAAPSTPAAPAAPTTPAATTAAPATPAIARAPDGTPLISNVFFESDLRQALADIATQAGVTIIPDNTVQGSVTAELKEVPLERALEMVLQVGGYTFAKMEGYYLCGAPDPSNPNYPLLCSTEVVALQHTAPETILALLSGAYGRYLSIDTTGAQSAEQGGGVRAPTSAGRMEVGGLYSPTRATEAGTQTPSPATAGGVARYRVLITAPPHMIERIKADIALLDQPIPQIMLEAAVIEVSSQALENTGINWATRWIAQDMSGAGPNLVYSTVANEEMAALTALVRNGEARLRANPRVATLEGQTAELEVGKENYFTIISGPVNFPYATLERITSGILLRITPRVLEETKEIVALIQPEVRDVSGKGENGLPEITFRRALTQLRVQDGQSIIIGGLIVETQDRTTGKIPILGDIPLIGQLFRTRSARETKTEVVIVITPHIVTDWATAPSGMSPSLQEQMQPPAAEQPLLTPRERIRQGVHHWSEQGGQTPPPAGPG